MQMNVGKIDKVIRIVAALAIIAAGIYFKSLWGFVGIIPLITALSGFCPLYTLFGIKTCKR